MLVKDRDDVDDALLAPEPKRLRTLIDAERQRRSEQP